MNVREEMAALGARAVEAARQLAGLNARKKNLILEAMAAELETQQDAILAVNREDVAAAQRDGLTPALVDRLTLTPARVEAMVKGLRVVAGLKDPVGARISRWIRPNGLEIVKQRVPIGVIAIIYEARPNVTADTAGLCFKSGNAVILRGGKEALRSNALIARLLVEGGRRKGLPEHAIQFVATVEREAVQALVQLEGVVDLAIPRGGEALIRAVTEHARVPVIKHYKGVCHVYVDQSANLDMALHIVENAKCQRPGVCNAMETLLVHEKVAPVFLRELAVLLGKYPVELRGDEAARRLVPDMAPATEADWQAEYLALILAVRVVPSVAAAIAHINTYGSRHSDAIVAEDEVAQDAFVQGVDAAAVYVNASTRFTDGGEFGMGAEIGISTDKLHARGPMGLEELTTYKFIVRGKGQVRA